MDTPRLWPIDEPMETPDPPPKRVTDAELDRLEEHVRRDRREQLARLEELGGIPQPDPWLPIIALAVRGGYGRISVPTAPDKATIETPLAAMRNALPGLLAEVRAARELNAREESRTMKTGPDKNSPLLLGCFIGRPKPNGQRQIAVWCPYCLDLHIHGWDTTRPNRDRAEHRGAHCHNGDSPFRVGGYWIGLLPKKALPATPGEY